MYFSSIFIFSLLVVVNLSLSGADDNGDLLNSNYKMSPYDGPQVEVVNIGNGYRRHNVVVLDQNPSNSDSFQRGGSNADVLGYRFGSTTHNVPQSNPGQPRQYPSSTVNNIGNGYHNYNTVTVNSGGRTPQTQHRSSNTGNSEGTSFVSPSGTDLFNVGYGTDNHNQILVNGRPLQPQAPVNSGGRTPQAQHRSSNTGNSGGTSFVSPSGTDQFNVGYGTDNHNQILVNGRPLQPQAPVNSGGRTPQTQHRSSNTGNSGGTSFVSPSGTDQFNVGYGTDNHNQILVDGRPLQPQAPVNSGGRTQTQTQNNARNNGGQESNSNQVYVNGHPIQPVYNDGTYSTYVLKDQIIHVLNSGYQFNPTELPSLKHSYQTLSAQRHKNTVLPLDSDKHSTDDKYTLNIGNGIHRNNNVILDLRPKADEDPNTQYIESQSNILGNRFSDDPQPGPRPADNSRKISSITNGNGYQNQNTIVTVNSDGKNAVSQDSNSFGETMTANANGTSFVHTRNDGLDILNVGHGSGNKNEIISDISAHLDNTGSQSSKVKEFETQLKILLNIAEQLEQVLTQLIQEVHMDEEQQ